MACEVRNGWGRASALPNGRTKSRLALPAEGNFFHVVVGRPQRLRPEVQGRRANAGLKACSTLLTNAGEYLLRRLVRYIRSADRCLAVALLLLLPAAAQIKVGDDLNMRANGNIFFGYSGDYGNQVESAHGMGVGGAGALSGFYYDPNFLNFNLSPYYDQSRSNSESQSISNASGFNFGAGIFSGSHFPGSISYAKAYNSDGNFGVPGLPNYTTHGNNQSFGISWSELVPDKPSLSASFQMGSNNYSVYGTDENGNSAFHDFSLRSGYTLDGFNLGAFYSNSISHSLIPEVLSSQQTETAHTDSDAFGFTAGHPLPLHGSWSASFVRSDVNSDFAGYGFNGTIDSFATNASAQPTNKLYLSSSFSYSDNLTGTLYQSIIPTAGGGTGTSGSVVAAPILQQSNPGQPSHALDMLGNASYSLLPNLQALGYVERRTQYFLGENYGSNSYGGGLTYGRPLFGGSFNTAVSVTDSTIDNSNVNTLGFTTTATYNRRFGLWFVGGGFSYAQNVNTLLITYMTSYYSYSGNVRRRFGALTWTGSASFSRTGLTEQPDTKSTTQTYSTGIGYRQWISLSGSYSDSSGNGLLTGTGLTTTPLPVIIPPGLLTFYGGTGYSVGLGSSPVQRLTIGVSFSHAISNTLSQEIGSWNKTELANALFQYQFRKMYVTGGYTRFLQGFSASGLPPGVVSSFSVGVSRWFDFF